MAHQIPDGIQPDHILAAIEDLRAGVPHAFGESTRYDLLFDGRRYPPKAVIGLAAGKLTGSQLGPYDFKGGLESACFGILEANGFAVVDKVVRESTTINGAGRSEPRRSHTRSASDRSTAPSVSNPDWTRDELILALDMYLQYRPNAPAKQSPAIALLSETLVQLGAKLFPPAARSSTFRNANGVYMKLMNLRRFDTAYTASGKKGLQGGAQGEEAVWTEFAHDPSRCRQIAEAIKRGILDPEVPPVWSEADIDEGIQEAPEGRLLTRTHFIRERRRELVDRKRRQAMRRHGKLACEVCDFDFAVVYGERGLGFIECHHTRPVASLTEGHNTHIDTLALVCANCHRIIHRGKPWLTIDEARSLLKRN